MSNVSYLIESLERYRNDPKRHAMGVEAVLKVLLSKLTTLEIRLEKLEKKDKSE